MPPKQSTSRSRSPAAKRGGAATNDEKAVVVVVAICAALVYLNDGGIKAPVSKKFCHAKCKFANRCDCDGDGRPDCIDLNTCDYEFAQCKAYYGSMHGWKMTEATILEFCTFVDADDFDVTLVPKVTAPVLVAPQVDLACVEKHVKAGSLTSQAFAVCDCRGASGANPKECAEEMGSEGEYSQEDVQAAPKTMAIDLNSNGIPDAMECFPPLHKTTFLQQLNAWYNVEFPIDVTPYKPAPAGCGDECMCLAVCDLDGDGTCDEKDEDDDGDDIPDTEDKNPLTCDNNGDGICDRTDKDSSLPALSIEAGSPAEMAAQLGDLADPDGPGPKEAGAFVDIPGPDSDGDGIPDAFDPSPYEGCPAGQNGKCMPAELTSNIVCVCVDAE